jgi:ribosomal protein S27AE
MIDRECPNCGSGRVRRGGTAIWSVYVVLIMLSVPAVLLVHLNAALVAGVMLVAIAAAHLVFHQWVCGECAHQWKG